MARNEKPTAKKQKVASKYKNVLKMSEGFYPFKPGQGSLGKHRAKSKRVNEELGKYSLTEKQNKVLQFVAEHINKISFPPTVRQIATYFGISAKAAHDHLRAIAKKGYIRLFAGSARGMEIVNSEPPKDKINQVPLNELVSDITSIPLLGTIAAGTPILAEENIERRLTFPRSFLPKTGNMFALRVKGDSMVDAGILDGDIAVLKQVEDVNSEVKNGNIVAAMIDGDATLKTFQKKRNKIVLLPQNASFKPIELTSRDNAHILGRLVGVYRKY